MDILRAKSEVLPGLEPGTFSVLTRCHDQLDHSTKLFSCSGLCMFSQWMDWPTLQRSSWKWKQELDLCILHNHLCIRATTYLYNLFPYFSFKRKRPGDISTDTSIHPSYGIIRAVPSQVSLRDIMQSSLHWLRRRRDQNRKAFIQ